MDYSLCHFPFYYNGNTYINCLANHLSPGFCATTGNFTRDKSWVNCPVVCTGFPEPSQKVTGFRSLLHKQPCVFKQQLHRNNTLKIRDYFEPPCQLDYTCDTGFKKLYDEIECSMDGSFDKKAYCVAEVTGEPIDTGSLKLI